MTKERPPTYKPAPEPPTDPDLRRRYDAVMAVITQTQTVTAAAASLEMSRNHFQTILHRAIEAVIEAVTPKPAGRPAKPEREAALEAENARLKTELAQLQDRTAMLDRLMTVVGGIASGRQPVPRSRARSTKKKPEDPEPDQTIHRAVTAMRDASIPVPVVATVLGVSPATVHRHRRAPQPKSHRVAATNAAAAERVRTIVRATHGLVGATSLGKRCGLPRRAAATIKRRELREMEHERKAACGTVSVCAPGIIRGFDAMHLQSIEGRVYWLVGADGAVPYRTSIKTVEAYDAKEVIAALRADFESHGPPLVLRLDRIACQRTPEVHSLLREYEVLPLHGPPRHPYYYGQLERQNREHRAWERALGTATRDELTAAAARMRTALNALWARPTLDWCTAEEVWNQRVVVSVDRRLLHNEVQQRTSKLVTTGLDLLHAQRLATESALTERGLLTINPGGWC